MKKYSVFFTVMMMLMSLTSTDLSAQKTGSLEKYLPFIKNAYQISQEKMEKIWDGYDLNTIPLAIFNDNEAFLFNHPAPDSNFAPTGIQINNKEVYHSAQKVPGFYANTSRIYNDHHTSIINPGSNLNEKSFYNLLFKEAFHTFASSHINLAGRYGDALLVPFLSADDPEYYALAFVEQQILKDALTADSENERIKKIQEFYLVYYRRLNRVSEKFREFENGEQIKGGLAAYAGFKGLELMGFEEEPLKRLKMYLDRKIKNPKDIRTRCYTIGASIAYLLDRYYPDWKVDLSRNINLIDLLRVKVPSTADIDIDVVLDNYRFEVHRALNYRLLYKINKDRKAKIREFTSYERIELLFSTNIQIALNYDPSSIEGLSDTLVLHSKMLKLEVGAQASIDINGIQCMTAVTPKNLFRIKVLTISKPDRFSVKVDGVELKTFKSRRKFKNLELSADGVKYLIKNGIIFSNKFSIVIDIRPQDG